MKSLKQAARELADEIEAKQRKKQLAENGLAFLVTGRVPDKDATEHAKKVSDAARAGSLSALLEPTYSGGRSQA